MAARQTLGSSQTQVQNEVGSPETADVINDHLAESGGASTGDGSGIDDVPSVSYEEIMRMSSGPVGSSEEGGGSGALASRLVAFRKWLSDDALIKVHPSICVVNGEATDGTKNAPVLTFGPPPLASSSQNGAGSVGAAGSGRCGMVDDDSDRVLFDRTMGCQVRVARELKKDEVMMEVPRSAMITPDLIAASDAGRAVLACCQPLTSTEDEASPNFWDAFQNTRIGEKKFSERVAQNGGTQLLVKILQERKKVEAVVAKAERALDEMEAKTGGTPSRKKSRMVSDSMPVKLVPIGTISTRVPVLAFLIHQRFANEIRPMVVSSNDIYDSDGNEGRPERRNAASTVTPISPPLDSPETFSPYARTIPPGVSLPICWKRNELALLAGCIPGVPPLLEIVARTLQLSSELIALVEGGILHRFPHIFSRGLITWDRWVWAAAVHDSRLLPASCFLNKGEEKAVQYPEFVREQCYSHPEIWDELGVMIPLLDMLNHESDTAQISWDPPPGQHSAKDKQGNGEDADKMAIEEPPYHHPRALVNKRVKKGSQVYTNYGNHCNQQLILQYGFAQMNNLSDEVRIGWGLMDAVGKVAPPADYELSLEETLGNDDGNAMVVDGDMGSSSTSTGKASPHLVFESSDSASIVAWWTDKRLSILEKEGLINGSVMSLLKKGKKLSAVAYCDGTYHPILLTAGVIATMPPKSVRMYLSSLNSKSNGKENFALSLSTQHIKALRHYLSFLFKRKLEKLLQSLNNGLKDHFNNVQLWTKATSGGLQYKGSSEVEGVGGEGTACIGWQSFFDSYAYSATMEVEKKYYAMGPDSCVLTLYDGHLRALQASIAGVSSKSKFEEGVLGQLQDLGFVIGKDETDGDGVSTGFSSPEGTPVKGAIESKTGRGNASASDGLSSSNGTEMKSKPKDLSSSSASQPQHSQASDAANKSNGSERNKKNRTKKKGDRPPAMKLHIGNLSYNTPPSSLFDFFANLYGRENVLECHIPTERETGKSRGFGFVTMPESSAVQALCTEKPHEIDGRVLKVAESNTAGSGKTTKTSAPVVVPPSDRCSSCGYRPKYCTCSAPNIPNVDSNSMGHPPMSFGDPHGHLPPAGFDMPDYGASHGRLPPDYDGRSGRHRSRSWSNRGRTYSRSPSPRGSGNRRNEMGYSHHRDRGYENGYRDYRDRSFSRSRSGSYSRGRDRDRDRGKRERDRPDRSSDSRSGNRRNRSGGSSSGWGGRSSRGPRYSRSRSDSRSPSGSRSYSKRRDRGRKGSGGVDGQEVAPPRGRNGSRSPSPLPPPARASGGGSSEKKKDTPGRKRSRSRSKGRRRKRSSKKDISKRARSKSRSRSRSRSRSWSHD